MGISVTDSKQRRGEPAIPISAQGQRTGVKCPVKSEEVLPRPRKRDRIEPARNRSLVRRREFPPCGPATADRRVTH